METPVRADGDPEARRVKELEKENSDLKRMLAGSRLKNRLREIVNAKKMVSPGHQRQLATLVVRDGVGSGRAACPLPRRGTLHVGLSTAAPVRTAAAFERTHA